MSSSVTPVPSRILAYKGAASSTVYSSARAAASVHLSTAGVGILHVAERSSMVYLTKSQRDSMALFLALPCRNCGCGIRARTLTFIQNDRVRTHILSHCLTGTDLQYCSDSHSLTMSELQRKSEILKRRLESNRIMLKEQTELKEALAQAKEEVLARAKQQATDENKFNELYRQREMELNDLKLELRYAQYIVICVCFCSPSMRCTDFLFCQSNASARELQISGTLR